MPTTYTYLGRSTVQWAIDCKNFVSNICVIKRGQCNAIVCFLEQKQNERTMYYQLQSCVQKVNRRHNADDDIFIAGL
jgi:hypothetical protein